MTLLRSKGPCKTTGLGVWHPRKSLEGHNRFLWETREVQLALGQAGRMVRVAKAQAYGSQVSLVQRPQWLVLASSVALEMSLSK